jgi:hypothetical protein
LSNSRVGEQLRSLVQFLKNIDDTQNAVIFAMCKRELQVIYSIIDLS